MNREKWSRRAMLRTLGAGALGAAAFSPEHLALAAEPAKPKGNIKQSVCRWCYGQDPAGASSPQERKQDRLQVRSSCSAPTSSRSSSRSA